MTGQQAHLSEPHVSNQNGEPPPSCRIVVRTKQSDVRCPQSAGPDRWEVVKWQVVLVRQNLKEASLSDKCLKFNTTRELALKVVFLPMTLLKFCP